MPTPQPATTPELLDAQCVRLMAFLPHYVRKQWQAQGACLDLSEYLDCAHDALLHALERFDPTRGASFKTFAMVRIAYAMRDVRQRHDAWYYRRQNVDEELGRGPQWEAALHAQLDLQRRLRDLPPLLQDLAHALLQGYEVREFAGEAGMTAQQVWNMCSWWRQSEQRARARGVQVKRQGLYQSERKHVYAD